MASKCEWLSQVRTEQPDFSADRELIRHKLKFLYFIICTGYRYALKYYDSDSHSESKIVVKIAFNVFTYR